ncbi:uncharacterized protein THITE_110294 [Thermothielavioides terrestris NRRL 8126]|uniref:Uncharacterized protein n=1 Tax=Thermothielavioides terrestris (strain ATCC 38088 / NRRL 8126) TaxID=578455 RepID=G2R405_THETT|nr:uncharacterized protein THITE_110294 [Thermothielavioides terrestris NRRL 8126]AEO66857.1 hypothetical protein THITE_110294 [Thermothielavioides terrestris NRRL 8126]
MEMKKAAWQINREAIAVARSFLEHRADRLKRGGSSAPLGTQSGVRTMIVARPTYIAGHEAPQSWSPSEAPNTSTEFWLTTTHPVVPILMSDQPPGAYAQHVYRPRRASLDRTPAVADKSFLARRHLPLRLARRQVPGVLHTWRLPVANMTRIVERHSMMRVAVQIRMPEDPAPAAPPVGPSAPVRFPSGPTHQLPGTAAAFLGGGKQACPSPTRTTTTGLVPGRAAARNLVTGAATTETRAASGPNPALNPGHQDPGPALAGAAPPPPPAPASLVHARRYHYHPSTAIVRTGAAGAADDDNASTTTEEYTVYPDGSRHGDGRSRDRRGWSSRSSGGGRSGSSWRRRAGRW